jgi:hypothetical protein
MMDAATSSTAPTMLTWMTPLATGVLTFFAGVQIWQVRKESKDRQRAAFASLYAEFLHLSSLSAEWAEEDLVELAHGDALRPEDMLPRDWGTLIRLLGEVGSATGALGAMAYQTVAEASKRTRVLVHLVRNLHVTGDAARRLEEQIKAGIVEAARVFEDAMRSAPRWLTDQPITFVEPQSTLGINVTGTMRSTQMRIRGPVPQVKMGAFGGWLGGVAARLALWLDPTLEVQLNPSRGGLRR